MVDSSRVFTTKLLIVFSIVFTHLMIAAPLGFPLTPTPFLLIYFIFKLYDTRYKVSAILAFVTLMLLPFAPLLGYPLNTDDSDIQFVRTFALWTFAVAVLSVAWGARIEKFIDVLKPIKISFVIVACYTFFQVAFFIFIHSTLLYYPFGPLSYKGISDASRIVWDGHVRAQAFYSEPSFLGFIIFALVTIIYIRQFGEKSHFVIFYAIAFLTMIAVASDSGLLAMLGLGAIAFSTSVRQRTVRNSIIIFFVVIAFLTVFYVYKNSAEIFPSGTSGYWRLVAPITILSHVLTEYPLGIPFGQMEAFVRPFGMMNGDIIGTSIDNGTYYFIFLFGWFGLAFDLWLLSRIVIVLLNRDRRGAVYWWFILASLQFSGGIMLPEVILPIFLTTYVYRSVASRNVPSNGELGI